MVDYLSNIEHVVEGICEECHHKETEMCNYRKCSIGFTKYIVKNVKENSIRSIEDGESLLPKDDLKYYEEKMVAGGIANICRLCKECNENHSENCVIALMRSSLEYTQLKGRIEYPGNIIMYLINLTKQKPELAELIKQEYMCIE